MFVFFKNMEKNNHCPQTGKIYIIILFCLIFTSVLISISVISKDNITTATLQNNTQTSVTNNLFGTGIAVNVLQNMFTIYLLYIDIVGKCSSITTDSTSCGNCKWYNIAPNLYKCTNTDIIKGYVYIPIILISSAYLLTFGITMITKSDDPNDEKDITTLSIASVILGAIGILYIISDLGCNIKCYCD